MIVLGLLSAITLIVCLSQIICFSRLCRYVDLCLTETIADYQPKLAVILPCKGLDPDFKQNVLKLLSQDYGQSPMLTLPSVKPSAKFEVIFAVAAVEDPAYEVLLDIANNSSSVPVKVVVAGVSDKRAQKINNQLCALREISTDVEVLVFVDSDMIAKQDFLRQLVRPLQDETVGATTGYRFYISETGDWASLIRALWNRMSAWEMADSRYAFAWGGAMAIRRGVFDRAEVKKHWDLAADDDLSLTTAVKDLGLDIRFVPKCLVASHGDATVAEIFEWTNRQLILTKVYYRRLWLRAIQKAVLMAVWLMVMIIALGGGIIFKNSLWLLASAIGLAILPIEFWFLVRAQKLWESVLPERKEFLKSSFWRFSLALPLAHIVLPWITLYSVLTNRIQWRGIAYELKSPTETIVL